MMIIASINLTARKWREHNPLSLSLPLTHSLTHFISFLSFLFDIDQACSSPSSSLSEPIIPPSLSLSP